MNEKRNMRDRKERKEMNQRFHTNFKLKEDRVTVEPLPKPSLSDYINKNNSIASREQMSAIALFMQRLFGLNLTTYPEETFQHLKSVRNLNPNAVAFIQGNTIVCSTELRDADIILEEFLHPLVKILQQKQPIIFNHLLDDAQQNFTKLQDQINISYLDEHGFDEQTRNNELVTQALARHFREKLGDTKDKHNDISSWIHKFIQFVKNLLFQREVHFTSKNQRIIPIESFEGIYTLEQLATILNTEGIFFNVSEGLSKEVTYHLETESSDGGKRNN